MTVRKLRATTSCGALNCRKGITAELRMIARRRQASSLRHSTAARGQTRLAEAACRRLVVVREGHSRRWTMWTALRVASK